MTYWLIATLSEGKTEPLVQPAAETLFWIGFLPVTSSMIQTWIVMGIMFLIIRLGTLKLSLIPGGLQNAIEAAVEGLEKLTRGLLEPKVADWAFPLVATYFIFIVFSNITDLLPGVGSIGFGEKDLGRHIPLAIKHTSVPLFRPPTSDANMTTAMALIFFIMSSFWAIRYHQGFKGLFTHIFGVKGGFKGWIVIPLTVLFAAVGLMEIISILIRPVALAMRLYGNIYGGETVLHMMTGILWGLPAVPFYFFEFMVAIIQALIFTLLSIVFTGTLCSHFGEEESKEE
ncbi:F0F1 ATP synthase subunit A [Methylacidiphilum caldifontis]|uniref:ATP synthase subunit a n=1 Tax=Methylacidiphilum caldifontis TaxID=2795386 RepID=A0A4Y8PEG2_9BACT|nr:F0F1 ATP synthase subunit A [Methylacidiphilum caldifontis]QSR87989.1 F0F1 ATP synthase subunit A [Methylacidiphilum caldifontis]TFE69529.1 ATP synthase F0 subunit A [Methylacidiphilum caldifontis]